MRVLVCAKCKKEIHTATFIKDIETDKNYCLKHGGVRKMSKKKIESVCKECNLLVNRRACGWFDMRRTSCKRRDYLEGRQK